MADVLETKKKLRANFKSKLTRFATFVQSFDRSQIANKVFLTKLDVKQKNAEACYSEFDDLQSEIEELSVDRLDEAIAYKDEVENLYFEILVICKEIREMAARGVATISEPSASGMNQLSAAIGNTDASTSDSLINVPIISSQNQMVTNVNPTTSQTSVASTSSLIRLPTIELPKFSGQFDEWLEFKTKYIAMIHKNASIDTMHKFHYLRACLVGSAAQIIGSLEFVPENYSIAWDALDRRFSKSGLLIHFHIKALHDLPKVSAGSALHLRNMVDSATKHLHCLRILGESVDTWDTILLYLFTEKLDLSLSQEWEAEKKNVTDKRLLAFFTFLERKAEFLETVSGKLDSSKGSTSNKKSFLVNKSKFECYFCKADHSIFKCDEFLALSVEDRIKSVNRLKLCENCFGRHKLEQCKRSGCRVCKLKHNTIIHREVTVTCSKNTCSNDVLLATACVILTDVNNHKHYARALLDCGSQANFISEELYMLLNLPKEKVSTSMVGISNLSTLLNEKCKIQIHSAQSDYKDTISCFIMKEITGQLPTCQVDTVGLEIPQNIVLADPDFSSPGRIDLLLGAAVFWRVMPTESKSVCLNDCGLRLQQTKLGWIVSGSLVPATFNRIKCFFSKHEDVQDQLENFWKTEEVVVPNISQDDVCERLFQETTRRAPDGKFIVRYPMCGSLELLSDTRQMALRQFFALERKFVSNPVHRKLYTDFMEEYIEMGHMSLLKNPSANVNYLPHHGVFRESSTTTKLRAVFNASARGAAGCSWNELQYTGPKVQTDLFPITLRFRQHRFVIGADVEKMYRQIWIAEDQRGMQVIFWRSSPDSPVETYMLNTVTYGTKSAPFLANRSMKELGRIHKVEFPRAAKVIEEEIFVDDVLTGGNQIADVIKLVQEVYNILISAQFRLRKWISNSEEILNHFQPNNSDSPESYSFGDKNTSKVLGISWHCRSDMLHFNLKVDDKIKGNSKRAILSGIAQIFDPLGLVAPIVITVKILLQEIWSLKLNWDDEVPSNVRTKWEQFKAELPFVNQLQIPRWILVEDCQSAQLHGFADASTKGFGCCIYVRSTSSTGAVTVRLLCAKSRVAPLKTISIPRLELSAALLLAELYDTVVSSMSVQYESVHLWSDSTISLHWLATSPSLLQTFVANRVAKIQRLTKISDWKHIRSGDNPADIISRGMQPSELDNSLWWYGPSWLDLQTSEWPISVLSFDTCPPEMKRVVCLVQAADVQNGVIEFTRYSDYNRLIRAMGYCLRFIYNCRHQRRDRKVGPLLSDDLLKSDVTLTRLAQQESFVNERLELKSGKSVSKIMQKLNAFIDQNDVMRVGGRLNSPAYSYEKRHPSLLNCKHWFTKLIFVHWHKRFFHLGPSALLAQVRDRYWPIAGRSLARQTVHKCVHCFRRNPNPIQPIMADLPQHRIENTYPFSIVGIDYGGPILIKDRASIGRGNHRTVKAYFAIFVCFVTKALHIEVVTSLSTESFLQAFRRFTSRRGCPKHVYSDNGKNFVGANRELATLSRVLLSNESKIHDTLSIEGINWHFSPPYSPHFGGLWERGIRSVKYYLRRVMTEEKFTYEQLNTALVQIEGILNTRPLCPLSNDVNELEPLTPSHFLLSRKMDMVPDVDVANTPKNRLRVYEQVQRICQLFWCRWKKEYLAELQTLQRWTKSSGEARDGALVIIKDENTPPMKWSLGRIIRIIPGRDNVTRVVELKTAAGNIIRPCRKICPLPEC